MSWRLVDSDLSDPEYTTACDEAILISRNRHVVPNTLHLYRRNAPTVSLGYFESVEESVDTVYARERGVKIVRRMSGGSAIYTDGDQLIYSLVLNKELVPESPQETFSLVCQGLVRALQCFDLQAEFKPVNDVLVHKKKISGSAQLRRGDVVVQHGSLIVRGDFETMFRVLKPNKGKTRTRREMTSLLEELGYQPVIPAVKYAIVKGFSEVFGVEIRQGNLTAQERKDIERLISEKYANDAYTYRR